MTSPAKKGIRLWSAVDTHLDQPATAEYRPDRDVVELTLDRYAAGLPPGAKDRFALSIEEAMELSFQLITALRTRARLGLWPAPGLLGKMATRQKAPEKRA